VSGSLSVALLSHLASEASPTGAERSLALLAAGLVRRGHRALAVAPGPWALEPELDAAGVEVRIQPCRVLWMTSYDAIPSSRAVAKSVRYSLPMSGERELQRLLSHHGPDVVHVNCLPHVRGARAARRAGIPVVWHLREILPRSRRRTWFAARVAESAHQIVAVSEAVAEWLYEEGLSTNVNVIHNGVPPVEVRESAEDARKALGVPLDGPVVGLFGQILPHKGVLEFVRAGRDAMASAPRLRCVIAGPGPREFVECVRREIESGPNRERFHLLPPRDDPHSLLAAADIVCLTTTAPDPLPRAVLEAMAAGLPVVTFRSGGAPEMVSDGETGFVVETGDERAVADRVARLALDRDLRATLGAAGRQRALNCFSLERHLDRMEQVLARAAS
jgi:glycosyltransferase involved in cell wall biosynthesis